MIIIPFTPNGPVAVSTVSSSACWAVAAACRSLLAPFRALASSARQVDVVSTHGGAIAIFARTHNVA